MKTYKLFSLTLFERDESTVVQKEIAFIDGIIMDLDDNGQRWLVDIVIGKVDKPLFRANETMLFEVVITGPKNQPVIMAAKLEHIRSLDSHCGLLFEGAFIVHHDALIEAILQGLVNEGFSGQALIEEYKKRRARDGQQRIIEQIYKQVKLDSTR